MTQPSGFAHPWFPNHVCKLHKALYRLKQATQAWFSRLSNRLLSLVYHGCRSNSSLFIHFLGSITIYVLIYIGDIFITGPDKKAIDSLLQALHCEFAIKDLGSLNFFLGIEAIHG